MWRLSQSHLFTCFLILAVSIMAVSGSDRDENPDDDDYSSFRDTISETSLSVEPTQPSKLTLSRRRIAFTTIEEVDADEYFRDFRKKKCKLPTHVGSEELEQPCRHRFIKEQFGRMFPKTEDKVFGDVNSWMGLKGDRKLSVKNVILQSGTAVWMHGCRRDQMTNDVDAWIAPVSPNTLVFNNPKEMELQEYVQQPFVWQPEWEDAFHISFTGDRTKIFERRLYDGEAHRTGKHDIVLGDRDDKEYKLLSYGEQIEGHLARIEYMRNGKVFIYLNEFSPDGKASGTKNPKVRIRKGSLAYGPTSALSSDQESRLTFELDLYTPFGALDGDYQWPWLASLSYLSRNRPKDTEMPVIPKHVAIVQKLKLYFDTFLTRNKDGRPEPHRVKHESENEHPTQFFIRNYKKMAQDIDDMQCLCGRCHEQARHNQDCLKLCSIVDVILSGEVEELPNKRQLFDQYEAALSDIGQPSMVEGVNVDGTHIKVHAPPATQHVDIRKRTSISRRLREFEALLQGNDWREATLQRKFVTGGLLEKAKDIFPEAGSDPATGSKLQDSLCIFSSNCNTEE